MNQMLLRIVVVISVWASTVFGAARLFGDVGARAGAAAGVLALSLLAASRLRRRRRLRVWNGSGESVFPPGPRRVLLLETGLGRPE
jgi:hypothetical protein